MAICIGDKFASYDSFRAKVQEIERSTDCMFVIESSKTVECQQVGEGRAEAVRSCFQVPVR